MPDQFAPTPEAGAAYRWFLQTDSIGDIDTDEKLATLRTKVRAVLEWAKTQPTPVLEAYRWGGDKVLEDATGRLTIHKNSHAVNSTWWLLPKPPEG